MKKDFTSILFLLDRSGSMTDLQSDVIGGFNTFLTKQKSLPGYAELTLVQFDDKYEVNYRNKNLKDVSKLNKDNYQPRGSTALLDAIGRSINELGQHLALLNEEDRPERVIFISFSDGLENSSKELTYEKINEMITHQTNKYGWSFIYLGANQDAIKEASKIGIMANKSMTYSASSIGTASVYDAASNLISLMRSCSVEDMNNVEFSEEDKKKQEELLKE